MRHVSGYVLRIFTSTARSVGRSNGFGCVCVYHAVIHSVYLVRSTLCSMMGVVRMTDTGVWGERVRGYCTHVHSGGPGRSGNVRRFERVVVEFVCCRHKQDCGNTSWLYDEKAPLTCKRAVFYHRQVNQLLERQHAKRKVNVCPGHLFGYLE